MNKYDVEILEVENQYRKKIKELKAISIESKKHEIPENEREVAELLHSKMCKYNHTDACGWFYDKGDWTEYSRVCYLKRQKNVELL
jgi:hypothetical protein